MDKVKLVGFELRWQPWDLVLEWMKWQQLLGWLQQERPSSWVAAMGPSPWVAYARLGYLVETKGPGAGK